MAGFIGMIGKLWYWCFQLFGKETPNSLTKLGDISTSFSPNDYFNLIFLKDISTNDVDFVSRHVDFYHNMSMRHGAPNYKLHWHFMSGASAYLPDYKANLLIERLFYSLDAGKGHRTIVDKSFIVYSLWNKNWTAPIIPSRFLEVNETAGSIYIDDLSNRTRSMEGPEDPRLIYDPKTKKIHLNFNVMTPKGDRQMFGETIQITHSHANKDFEYKKTEPLAQFEHVRKYRAVTEKNWVPIMIQDELHYLYSLTPLRILKCEKNPDISQRSVKNLKRDEGVDVTGFKKTCVVKFKGEAVNKGSQTGALRSGTNWLEYAPGVYFSLARTRIMNPKCSFAFYRPHLIVMKFDINEKTGEYYDPRILYVSDPITKFDERLFALYTKKGLGSGNSCDDRTVLTPGSISNWNPAEDLIDVVISINDDVNAVMRIEGFGRLIGKALDNEPSAKKSKAMTRKGTLAIRAEKEMKEYIEKSII